MPEYLLPLIQLEDRQVRPEASAIAGSEILWVDLERAFGKRHLRMRSQIIQNWLYPLEVIRESDSSLTSAPIVRGYFRRQLPVFVLQPTAPLSIWKLNTIQEQTGWALQMELEVQRDGKTTLIAVNCGREKPQTKPLLVAAELESEATAAPLAVL